LCGSAISVEPSARIYATASPESGCSVAAGGITAASEQAGGYFERLKKLDGRGSAHNTDDEREDYR
jgi:hypothetical protein